MTHQELVGVFQDEKKAELSRTHGLYRHLSLLPGFQGLALEYFKIFDSDLQETFCLL